MNTVLAVARAPIPRSCTALDHSVLALHLQHADLTRLEGLGEIVPVASGTRVFERGEASDHLYVVLDGVLVPEGKPSFWVGPGDLCGEGGFVLGAPRSTTMIALGPAPRLFRVHRDVLALRGAGSHAAVTRLLSAIGRALRARVEPEASTTAPMTEAMYCDHHHPRVVALARRLHRATPFETACAIWSHVWSMPYRFGSWQWSASDTASRGHGMCTTKAVLQVALLRAAGIESGFVKSTLDGALVRALMAPAYHARFERSSFKHYYAAAKIDGRWTPFDGSFSRASLALIAETEPEVQPHVTWDARARGYAHCAAALQGSDPFDIEVHDHLDDVIRKAASYDAKNADAMNVLLDRAQDHAAPPAAYTIRAEQAIAAGSLPAARDAVLSGVRADARRLRITTAPA